ncbi:putative membrane protein [Parabacteroides distasonis str. 3776 D15 iv]|nr:putative membrane protein [Parabacteroides distasonis str. 3776 D15 iv]
MTSEMDGLTGSSLFCFIILRQNVIFLFWYFFCKDISVK